MASLFSTPKVPTVPAPIPPPDTTQANYQAADRLRQRKGSRSTLLTPDSPESSAIVQQKSLLGS